MNGTSALQTSTQLVSLTAADFKAVAGQAFRIRFTDTVCEAASLHTVLDLPAPADRERKPFSLLFQTSLKPDYYPQGIYTIEHASLGSLLLFLVPVGITEAGVQYEAVFG